MASLWEAIGARMGFPPLSRPLPNRRSSVWEQFCRALEQFTNSPGSLHRRGPTWVHRTLHSTNPPNHMTWGTLLGDLSHASNEAISLLMRDRPSPSGVNFICWNVRWIVDLLSGPSVAKRNVLSKFLAKGYIVCLQETHWTDSDAALWQHGLLLRNLSWTPAQARPLDDDPPPQRPQMSMLDDSAELQHYCLPITAS